MLMHLYPANRVRTAVTLRDRNNNCQEGVSPAIKHTSADNRPSHAERMMIVVRGRRRRRRRRRRRSKRRWRRGVRGIKSVVRSRNSRAWFA